MLLGFGAITAQLLARHFSVALFRLAYCTTSACEKKARHVGSTSKCVSQRKQGGPAGQRDYTHANVAHVCCLNSKISRQKNDTMTQLSFSSNTTPTAPQPK